MKIFLDQPIGAVLDLTITLIEKNLQINTQYIFAWNEKTKVFFSLIISFIKNIRATKYFKRLLKLSQKFDEGETIVTDLSNFLLNFFDTVISLISPNFLAR